ncbi:MAG: LysM peptidoglycan-binding domain-containing protein, partial [Propionibacteriales bacterium]|nr:LysM peptidoglycan-binding domain-containing protein [Propionibacteriales bacterium]
MRFVKGVLALVTLTAVVLGMPVGIATFGQLPDPAQWADRSPLDILLTPDDGTLLINVLTVGAWLAWGVFTVSVLLELVSVLSRYRFRPRLPGLKLPQALAAGLIVAVIAMFVVQTVLPRGAAPSAPPNPVAAVVQTADAPRTTAIGAGGDTALPAADRAQVDDKQAEEKKDKRTRLHTVTKGEDLWSIAEQYYGQGDQWRTIATANAKLLKHGPDDLQIGWQLVIPGAGDTSEVSRVVVVKGDTLSSLAKEHLGSS